MSRLFNFRVHSANLTLRVDAAELEPLAADLHSSACEGSRQVSSDTPADIAWSPADSGTVQIHREGKPWERPLTQDLLFLVSEHLLTRLLCTRLDACTQLHAAAVCDHEGNACMIVGPSRAGKTSLVLSLILAGWRWLSDEIALIDPEQPGRLLGFPRNFNLKEGSWPQFPETEGLAHNREFDSPWRNCRIRCLDPNVLRPGSHAEEASLRTVLLPEYSTSPTAARLEPVAGVRAAGRILPELIQGNEHTHAFLLDLLHNIPCFSFHHHDPRDIVPCADRLRTGH